MDQARTCDVPRDTVPASTLWPTRFPWYYKAKMTWKEVKPNKYQSFFDVSKIRVSQASRWNVQPGRFPNLWFLFCPFLSGRSAQRCHSTRATDKYSSAVSQSILSSLKFLFRWRVFFLPVRLSPCSYACLVHITSRNTVRREMHLHKLYGQSGAQILERHSNYLNHELFDNNIVVIL